MPKAQIKIKRKFSARSDRVKSVDIHPTEPWMLVALYNGKVQVINVHSQDIAKSFDVCELPVRAACFVARMRWVVCGADDMKVRVFNYNTAEKVVSFDAHNDYIRTIAVHPTQGLLLTGSDDMSIKMWDWNKAWACVMTFEGHSHYVMEVVFSPRDPNTFASASLDKTIKVWGLNSASAHFTLEGHEKGVNCVDYFCGDKPFLASGSDDSSVKIWDYQTRTCVQTLEGHSNNVASVKFHHDRPLILSGGEDGQCIVWNSATFKLECRLDYQMERVWSIGLVKGTNRVALGCDEGSVLLKLGKDSPIASMDSSGKIIWANNNEIQTVNSKSATGDDMVDGEKLALAVKDLGTCDFVPDQMKHSPNGRLVAVVGDGEFIIYTALAWRNKAFGTAVEFVWGSDSNFYATREGSSTVKVWKGFAEHRVMRVEYAVDGIFGGPYLCIRSDETLLFHDWETGALVFNIGSNAKVCLWNDTCTLLAVCSDSQFFVLQVHRDNIQSYLEGSARGDEGCLNALDVVYEISDKVRACKWIGDVLVFTSATDRLSYCLGGNVQPITHLDRRMFLLGYMPNLNRVFLVDKMFNVVSYELLSSVLDFQNAVVKSDIELAESLVKTIPEGCRNKVARFVESLGHPALALDISRDNDYKCDLAMQLGKLDLAKELVLASPSENKWRHLGDLALKKGQIALADSCMLQAGDVNSLLLLRSSLGDANGIKELSAMAQSKGRLNVAFVCEYMLGNVEQCIAILQKYGRYPEAAMLARSYKPRYSFFLCCFCLFFVIFVVVLSAIASNCGNLPFLWRNAGMITRKIMLPERLFCSQPSSDKRLPIPLVIQSNYPISFQCTSFTLISKKCCSLRAGASNLLQHPALSCCNLSFSVQENSVL